MNLKRFLAQQLLGTEYKRLAESFELVQRIPQLMANGSSHLVELDSQALDLLGRFSGEYDVVYGTPYGRQEPTEQERLMTVYRARRAALFDPVSISIVRMWLNFAFGFNIEVIPKDETEPPLGTDGAAEVWDEYFTARRNESVFGGRSIDDLNRDLLSDGELYFLNFTNIVDGRTTTRLIPTEQIPADGIITDPDDKAKPLYYRRQFVTSNGDLREAYYPDWAATDAELGRANLPAGAEIFNRFGTKATVLHVAFNRQRRSGRGWPLLVASMDWSLAYKENLQDQAAVARAVAMFVDKLKVKGGSRVLTSLRNRFQSSLATGGNTGYDTNPPAVAGSTWMENDGVSRERMPLSTGASDNAITSSSILGQALTAAGNIPLDWMNRPDSSTYAQAKSANIPVFRNFNRYQLFWRSVWADLCEIVLMGYMAANPEAGYETLEANVNLDNLLESETGEVVGAVGTMFRDIITPLAGKLPIETETKIIQALLTISLQSLGVRDAGELVDFEVMTDGVSADGVPTMAGQPGDNPPENLDSTEGLNGIQIRAVLEVLAGIGTGTTPPLVAVELLIAVGIDDDRAQRIVDETVKNKEAAKNALAVNKEVSKVVEMAMANYRAGKIGAEDIAEYLLSEFITNGSS